MNPTRCPDCPIDEGLHRELAALLDVYDDEHRRMLVRDARKRHPRPPRTARRARLAAAGVLLAAAGVILVTRDEDEPARWVGPLATVSIEQTHYERADGLGVYLKLVIGNPGPREIGVDLDRYADLLHRSELSPVSADHRPFVIRLRKNGAGPPPTTSRERVVESFRRGGLLRIGPGATAEVFRLFYASRERRLTEPNGTYLMIGADPLLLVTDGVRTELITTSREESSQQAMNELARRGVRWATLPADALFVPTE